MTYELILGDCIQTMRGLPAGSIQCAITSPPYYGLRAYLPDDHPDKHLEIGTEQTPEEYVCHLVEVFREVRRVLRDDGTLWLNLDSSYNGSGGAGGDYGPGGVKEGQPKYPGRNLSNFKPKDMIPIPWMVAMALQQDGYYLRSDIIWNKPSVMPESVTDRPTGSHEYIFLLSKSREYYYDAEAIKEPTVTKDNYARDRDSTRLNNTLGRTRMGGLLTNNYEMRNKRSVWTVAAKPYFGSHYATFPMDLIEPCILAGTSERGCCVACGAPWERLVERTLTGAIEDRPFRGLPREGAMAHQKMRAGDSRSVTTSWQPTCACNADVVPCTVLDPFFGSGTTAAVALKHGRRFIGCDIDERNIELAHDRISKSQPMLFEVTA